MSVSYSYLTLLERLCQCCHSRISVTLILYDDGCSFLLIYFSCGVSAIRVLDLTLILAYEILNTRINDYIYFFIQSSYYYGQVVGSGDTR